MVNHNGDHSDAKDQSPSSPATSRIDEEEFSDTLVADAKQTTPRTAFLRLRWKMLPIVALLVGLASTTTLWLTTAANETNRPRSDFSAGVVNIRDEIQERLNLHVQLMEGLQAFFQSSNDLSRAQFHNYLVTTHAFGRYPGIKAVQFARQITHDQKSNFERQVRHDASIESGAYADFSVTPPGERASYLVVEYNEPMEGNEAALGYDQAYQAARREAMERARDTGLPAASAPIEFLQDSDKRPGFVLYVPVYRTGMPIDSAERRRAAFAGQLSIVYVTEELINSVLTSSPELNRLSLTDQGIALAAIPAPGQTPKLLFDRDANRPDAKSATRESDWVDSLPVHIGGRVWELRASSSAPMTLFRPFPLTILLGGTAITILLWRILQVSMRQRHRAVLLARRMTRDLQNGVARLSAVVNTAVDSIVVIDAGGLIESVNPATERMFGYRSAEMLGCNVKMLMPDTFAVEHDQYVSNYLHTGQKKIIGIGRQVTCKRKDGTTFPADLAISELEVNGARKFTGILRDTTERMQAELALAAERDLVNSMLASLPDQIYFKDEHSRFLRINPGLARRYSLSDASAAIGKSDADFFSAEHAERTRVVERRIVESGEAVIDVEEREIWKDRPPHGI